MTQVKQPSTSLKELQDAIGKKMQQREEAARNYKPSSIVIKQPKADIRKEPTAEDILLMEEYRRGVYQGD